MVLRWGIIGAGEIAGRSMAPALNRAAATRLTAVYSRHLDKAQAFADRFQAERAYDSLDSMLADPGLDCVYIATPNSLHAEQTVLAARAGKHVLCEKPMAITMEEGELMIEVCARHRVKLGAVYQNRFHPAHFEARRRVASGALGEIQLASAQLCRGYARDGHWRGWRVDPKMTGSGAIVAQAVHPIDLLRFLLGAEVAEVQAMTDEQPPARPVEEMVYSLLKFRNGTHATVIAGTLVPRYDNDVLLYGAKGKITCKGTLGVPLDNRSGELSVEGDAPALRQEFPLSTSADKMLKMVEDFNRAVIEDTEPAVSGHNGLQMIRIAVALQESSRSGRAVKVQG
jgi:1,5-anhydro-D-fructose reductase (1,5-anhydro-D-mannitol-forming)